MNIRSTIGGLAGACALTVLNEGMKKLDRDAPRLDLLGMNAVARLVKGNDILPKTAGAIFPAALAADLATNTLYFGMAEARNQKDTLIRGAWLGLIAGVGAVILPKTLGLQQEATARTLKTRAMTVSWYFISGLVAAAAINLIGRKAEVCEHANDEIDTGKYEHTPADATPA